MNTETFQLNFQTVTVIAIILSVISLIFVGVALIRPYKGQFGKLMGEKLHIEISFLLVLNLIVLVIVAIAAFYVGTYVRYGWLENIWESISAVASCCGVVASIGAVWAAIQIPRKIAEQQEKVELYERRFEFYDTLCSCIHYAKILGEEATTEFQADYLFVMILGHDTLSNITEVNAREKAGLIIWKVISSLGNGAFLFDFDTKGDAQNICSALISIITAQDNEQLQECRIKYLKLMDEIHDRLIPLVEKSLRLTKDDF